MTDAWTGGIVESPTDEAPPTVDEWAPVDVPGRPERFAGVDGPIAYRTRVADPRTAADERAFLELRGAYDRVRAWADGEFLGSDDTYFRPSLFEFEPAPAGETELLVECAPPPSCRGIYGTDEVPDRLAVPGVWWDADVIANPATFVRDLAVRPRVGDEAAVIDVDVTVDAGEAVDDAVTLSLRPEGFRGGGSMDRARLEAGSGERVTVSKRLRVRDPSRWWPREHGPQHRYAVRAKIGDDARERIVGLRTVERDDGGYLVNGERVRAHGVVGLPGGDAREAVERALDVNATIVRARARVPSRSFVAACDEAGLLCWLDLPATGGEFDVERATALAAALDASYAGHPSVATCGIRDRPIDPFAEPLGSGFLAKLAYRWRAWRAALDREGIDDVADALPDDVPVVPVTGPPGTGADAAALAPGWAYLEATDVDWLLERYPTDGVGAIDAGSLVDDVDPESVPGLDAAALDRRTDGPADSRAYQARVLKTVVEALRRRDRGAVVAAPLRDAAPGGGPGLYARDGSEKPAARAVADACRPVQAVLDGPPDPGRIGITLCNDSPEPVEGTVGWTAGDVEGETTAAADPFEAVPAGDLEIPPDAERVRLEVALPDRTVSNRYPL